MASCQNIKGCFTAFKHFLAVTSYFFFLHTLTLLQICHSCFWAYAVTGSCAKLHTGCFLICTHYYLPLSLFPTFPFIVRGCNIILICRPRSQIADCLPVLKGLEICTASWKPLKHGGETILSHGACFGVSIVSSNCKAASGSMHE